MAAPFSATIFLGLFALLVAGSSAASVSSHCDGAPASFIGPVQLPAALRPLSSCYCPSVRRPVCCKSSTGLKTAASSCVCRCESQGTVVADAPCCKHQINATCKCPKARKPTCCHRVDGSFSLESNPCRCDCVGGKVTSRGKCNAPATGIRPAVTCKERVCPGGLLCVTRKGLAKCVIPPVFPKALNGRRTFPPTATSKTAVSSKKVQPKFTLKSSPKPVSNSKPAPRTRPKTVTKNPAVPRSDPLRLKGTPYQRAQAKVCKKKKCAKNERCRMRGGKAVCVVPSTKCKRLKCSKNRRCAVLRGKPRCVLVSKREVTAAKKKTASKSKGWKAKASKKKSAKSAKSKKTKTAKKGKRTVKKATYKPKAKTAGERKAVKPEKVSQTREGRSKSAIKVKPAQVRGSARKATGTKVPPPSPRKPSSTSAVKSKWTAKRSARSSVEKGAAAAQKRSTTKGSPKKHFSLPFMYILRRNASDIKY